MAARDIMPGVSEHDGHARMLHFQMGAGTTATGATTAWRPGNPLIVDAGNGLGDTQYLFQLRKHNYCSDLAPRNRYLISNV